MSLIYNDIRLSRLPSTVLLMVLTLIGCSKKNSSPDHPARLFQLLTPAQTGVDFSNALTEGLNTNVLMYQYFYNGGGVSVGDLNGDGLQDIYFTGNMVDNKLYLNLGKMKFKDITNASGLSGRPGPWKTGVTVVDINGDGKLDLYVCYSGKLSSEKRVNQLFINQGNDDNGIPKFKEMAASYGLSFPSYSTQAYFFDFDRDGDLDLLLVNHNPQRLNILDEESVNALMTKPDIESGIRLLKNNNNYFQDYTKQGGVVNSSLSYGLAAGIADINGDGWPDIYISNDYSVPDRLYINNQQGKFSDELTRQIGHTSFYSMGNDIADINNDCKPDIYTLDMLPKDNKRQKLLFGADNYEAFDLNVKVGFNYQYMRNMLHINNGNNTFSEVGQLAGISNTDWSWAPLFADYDNDGWKDLFVSNGYTRDYTNMDFLKYMGDNLRNRKVMRQDLLDIVKKMPSSQIKSYFFKNNGDATFTNSSDIWGISKSSNSNGAAYVDLDNDGDLDMVVSNINQPAFIYLNTSMQNNGNHYLDIKLNGSDKNTQGIGAKVILYVGKHQQYLEQMPTRGYQSSVSPIMHFGLGKALKIDSLKITWQRNKMQVLRNITSNRLVTLAEKNAVTPHYKHEGVKPIFKEIASPIAYRERKETTNDFKRQPLMVNPLSFSGSCLAKADVNGDGFEDVFVGGNYGKAGALYIQQKNGAFIVKNNEAFTANKLSDDAAAIFFDADGDGSPDLYVCSGGYDDYLPNDPLLQDRLYLNNGKGLFKLSSSALPKMLSSKSCVKVADINGDKAPDLFVGGRVIPGRYPETPESFILINDGQGHFTDKTSSYNPAIKKIGMVTDAAWVNMNGDRKPDLVIVGEWMPITVFENTNGKLVDKTFKYFDGKYSGWWNCISISDINRDGHPDIIAGNQGTNGQCKPSAKEPAGIYYKDFDENGSVDPIFCFYVNHKSFPYASRDALLDQISMLRGRYPNYSSYANTTIDQIFTPEEMKGSALLSSNCFSTSIFISNFQGKLKHSILPLQAQYAPVFTITLLDYDRDGKEDVLLCGNMNNASLRFGKNDSNYGVLLKGDGKGKFAYIAQAQSGFNLSGDVRSVLKLNDLILFSKERNRLNAYKMNSK